MSERLKRRPKGERTHIRRILQLTREQQEVLEFRKDRKLADELLKKNCQGKGDCSHWDLVMRYWDIRHEYFGQENTSEYRDKIKEFNNGLPEKLDSGVVAALRVITSNFSRHPGRS